METTTKTFDAVAESRKWKEAVARETEGMTREQVVMSLGYPISSENPNLNSKAWTYWLDEKVQCRISFDDKDRLADVENTVDAKSKLLTE